jgi:hypothetical protein
MIECEWQSTYCLESKRLPKMNRALVGAYSKVELHGPKSVFPSVNQRVFAHLARDTSPGSGGACHVAAITNMLPST